MKLPTTITWNFHAWDEKGKIGPRVACASSKVSTEEEAWAIVNTFVKLNDLHSTTDQVYRGLCEWGRVDAFFHDEGKEAAIKIVYMPEDKL